MRGGKREGAGRKKGQENEATRLKKERTERAIAATPITPLEVMLQSMTEAWSQAKNGNKESLALALSCAKDAAPYVHPKLAQVDTTVDGNLTVELVQFSADSDTE
jgi:hypothetical protein